MVKTGLNRSVVHAASRWRPPPEPDWTAGGAARPTARRSQRGRFSTAISVSLADAFRRCPASRRRPPRPSRAGAARRPTRSTTDPAAHNPQTLAAAPATAPAALACSAAAGHRANRQGAGCRSARDQAARTKGISRSMRAKAWLACCISPVLRACSAGSGSRRTGSSHAQHHRQQSAGAVKSSQIHRRKRPAGRCARRQTLTRACAAISAAALTRSSTPACAAFSASTSCCRSRTYS